MLSRSGGPPGETALDEPLAEAGAPAAEAGKADLPRRNSTRLRVVTPEVKVTRRLADLWASRELLVYLVRKELTVKYKNSVLGFLWSMLNPALTLVVYYFVFQKVLKSGIPGFAIFLMCGLLVWNLFSAALPGATTAVVGNAGIVKKVAFPREILALASIGAAIVFFFLQAIVLALAMAIFRFVPALGYLWLLVPALLALLVLCAALCVFLSAVNVYLRDTQHLLEVALMAWFWATPIVYRYEQVSHSLTRYHLLWLYWLNPVTPIVLTFQRALYAKVTPLTVTGGQRTLLPVLPDHSQFWYLGTLGIVFGISAVLFLGAIKVFGHLEGNFAEEL